MNRTPWASALLAVGCGPLPIEPFSLDVSANCNEVVVEEVWADLDEGDPPWTQVVAAAMDGPEGDGVWLLVVAELSAGGSGLVVMHRDAAGTIVVVDEQLGVLPTRASTVSLVPGPGQGQLWLVEKDVGLFRLHRYDAVPQPVLLDRSWNHGEFPGLSCMDDDGSISPCDVSEWPRELVFLQGLPFVIAIPPSSDDSSIDILVSGVQGDLQLSPPINLNFDNECNDSDLSDEEKELCEAHKATITHPNVEPIAIQTDTRPPTTTLALLRETQEDQPGDAFTSADLALVVLGIDKIGRASGTLLSDPNISIPLVAEGQVAIDTRASYVLYRSFVPALVQFSPLTKEFAMLTDAAAPLDEKRLLQLDEDVALGRVLGDGTWEVTKLFPDAPEQSKVTIHDPGGELVAALPAGPGAFLLRTQTQGPDLVRVRCSDVPPTEP